MTVYRKTVFPSKMHTSLIHMGEVFFMWKKVTVILLAALLSALSVAVTAAQKTELIASPAGVLMEASTGKILFEKNMHEKRPCASITKVMTLLLVFEAMDSGKLRLDDVITTSEHAASMGGSDIWLEPGEKMSADDMIKATVVASANDAAVALAEHISGSEEAFVAQMNERAKRLGMKDTTFKNCNGLDEEGHLTSAFDVAVMSRELMKHKKIFDYTAIWLDTLRGGETQIVNTNKLLKTYSGITGLKTGTTDDAGCCVSATAERDGMSLIAVALGADTGKQRFADAAALLDYGFANYAIKELKLPEDLPESIAVEGGMEKTAALDCHINAAAVVEKASPDEVQVQLELPEKLQAPVAEGERVGSVVYRAGGDTKRFDVVSQSEVASASFGLILERLFNSFLSL